jgi:hypothetical protein
LPIAQYCNWEDSDDERQLATQRLATCARSRDLFGCRDPWFDCNCVRKAKISWAEFARTRQDVKQLAEDVKGLLVSEQIRFLQEIKASKKDDDQTPMAA